MNTRRIAVYGDFNCPWSYLAFRRAERLAAHGFEIDWRAVEHDPWRPGSGADGRFADLRDEIDGILPLLLPGERLPYSLAGFVPRTRSAVSGYAEAYGAGVPDPARRILFDAFWLNGIDIGDPQLVRTLLVDTIRAGRSTSDALHDWGYAVTRSGAPITTTAYRLVRSWREEWASRGGPVVPVVVDDDAQLHVGKDAVGWLGEQLTSLAVDLDQQPPRRVPCQRSRADLPHYSWASAVGERWTRSSQDLFRAAG